MINLKNIGQRQATINITCPECTKTFEHTFMQLPYPCYEARNEIDSERFDEVSIKCPNCHKEINGEVFATREQYFINIEGIENQDAESVSMDIEHKRNKKLYALLTWQSASMSHAELRSAFDKEEEASQIYGLTQKFIANIVLFISSKDTYPSQRKNLEELDDLVRDFMATNWNVLNSPENMDDIKEVLPDFLEKTKTIMSKWYEDEISLMWKAYVQG